MMEEKSPMMIAQPADTQTNQHISNFTDPPNMVSDDPNLLSFL